MEMFQTLQAWLVYATTFWWVRGVAMIAIFWIFMQVLPNRWAGGKLFDRAFAWITTAIAAIVAFIVFVLPFVSWQLLLGIVLVAVLVGVTLFLKK